MTGLLISAAVIGGLMIYRRKPSQAWDRESLEAIAIHVSRAEGMPDHIPFFALIDTESNWANAKNCTGGDGQRGCSWGPAQITLMTAREMDDLAPTGWRGVDPDRTGESLLQHPGISLRLAARYFHGAWRIAQKEASPSRVWADAAARYNAGWTRGLDRAPASTRDVYVPRFERNLARRRGFV